MGPGSRRRPGPNPRQRRVGRFGRGRAGEAQRRTNNCRSRGIRRGNVEEPFEPPDGPHAHRPWR
eukprot:10683480-Lingulodinium_polyedra.AAC.1